MTSPKAHHWIPAAHLARFSEDSGPTRRRRVWVADKVSASFRPAKVSNVFIESNLYSFRTLPTTPITASTPDELRAVLRGAPHDPLVEIEKSAVIEADGIQALIDFEAMPAGVHEVDEERRRPLVAYVALLLAQHPAMMRRRTAAIGDRFWSAAAPAFDGDEHARAMFEPLDAGYGVLSMVNDQLMLALELNWLAIEVIRWSGGPRLVLGDTGVVATFPGRSMGTGHPAMPGAQFAVPLSPHAALLLGHVRPGLCVVSDRSARDAERDVAALNRASWVRAAREVVGCSRDDIQAVISSIPPPARTVSRPDQLEVRDAALPSFAVDEHGDLHVEPPMSALDYDATPTFAPLMAAQGRGEGDGS